MPRSAFSAAAENYVEHVPLRVLCWNVPHMHPRLVSLLDMTLISSLGLVVFGTITFMLALQKSAVHDWNLKQEVPASEQAKAHKVCQNADVRATLMLCCCIHGLLITGILYKLVMPRRFHDGPVDSPLTRIRKTSVLVVQIMMHLTLLINYGSLLVHSEKYLKYNLFWGFHLHAISNIIGMFILFNVLNADTYQDIYSYRIRAVMVLAIFFGLARFFSPELINLWYFFLPMWVMLLMITVIHVRRLWEDGALKTTTWLDRAKVTYGLLAIVLLVPLLLRATDAYKVLVLKVLLISECTARTMVATLITISMINAMRTSSAEDEKAGVYRSEQRVPTITQDEEELALSVVALCDDGGDNGVHRGAAFTSAGDEASSNTPMLTPVTTTAEITTASVDADKMIALELSSADLPFGDQADEISPSGELSPSESAPVPAAEEKAAKDKRAVPPPPVVSKRYDSVTKPAHVASPAPVLTPTAAGNASAVAAEATKAKTNLAHVDAGDETNRSSFRSGYGDDGCDVGGSVNNYPASDESTMVGDIRSESLSTTGALAAATFECDNLDSVSVGSCSAYAGDGTMQSAIFSSLPVSIPASMLVAVPVPVRMQQVNASKKSSPRSYR